MTLSGVFDTAHYELYPGEDFPETGATKVIEGFHADPTAEDLDPFETPSTVVDLRETRVREWDTRFPLRSTEQAWGVLCVNLGAFCRIAETDRDQYQENDHSAGTTRFLFRSKTDLGRI